MTRADELLPVGPLRARTAPVVPLDEVSRAQLTVDELFVPGRHDDPPVRVLLYRPKQAEASLPVVLRLHGGGFVSGSPDDRPGDDGRLALSHQCAVVAVDYRLAPEHRFPAALHDCHAALLWIADRAGEHGLDTDRIVVVGGSAGGCLAAALTQVVRDRGGPPIAFQMLTIPVLDDRMQTPSMRQNRDVPGFNGRRAEGMWLHYLGEDHARTTTSPYAAPARAESLRGLPPAYIQTNGLDPLRDEGIFYGLRLLADDVTVEMHNVPGAYHGAPPLDPSAVERASVAFTAALRDALRPPSF